MKRSAEGDRFRTQRGDAASRLGGREDIDAALERGHRQHRRRAADEAGDAARRPVRRREIERRGVAEPARERLAQLLAVHARGVARMRPQERRRAGPAVQVLVAAADREVGIGAVQVDRHRARRVRQVPDDERAGRMRRARRRGEPVHAAAAVVDVGEHQHGDLVVQGFIDARTVDQSEIETVRRGDAFGHVEIGREVAALGEDDAARRRVGALQRDRGAERLEAVDRGRIADAHLARPGADQRRDLVADAARQVDPAGAVPAADEALAPLALGDFGEARRGPARQGAERVAVEVDDALGQDELVAQRGERVGAVEGQAALAAGDRRRRGGDLFHVRRDGSTGLGGTVSVNSHTSSPASRRLDSARRAP